MLSAKLRKTSVALVSQIPEIDVPIKAKILGREEVFILQRPAMEVG